jgi:hypothetical protein
MTTAITALFLLTAFLPAAFPAVASQWNGEKVEKDGVSHIMNPAAPTETPVTVQLEELWRLGGDSESDEEFFGVIGAIALDEGQNVYLLDRQLSEVKVFSPTGGYLRTIGREGEGPGEFRRPSDMFFTPEGDLAVLQTAPGKLVLLTPDGDPAGDFTIGEEDGGFRMLFGGESGGDNMVLAYVTAKMESGKRTRISILASFKADGTEGARYYKSESTMNFANPVVDERKGLAPTWALGPTGDVYFIDAFGEYRINVLTPGGEPINTLEREFEHLMRTDEEKEAMKKRFVIRGPVDPKIVVSEYEPDVNRLFPRRDETLWVLTSRGMKASTENVIAVFDVFDAEGRFTHQVTLEGQGDPKEDAVFIVGDRVFVVTQYVNAMRSAFGGDDSPSGDEEDEEPEPMEVICYRLDLGPDALANGGAGR